ncbi:uncharacterized protein [Brachionichthys hirsutus]|uniref:uncharacterized protein n=1 Tax=Brachionichthys hirsutus TaxID=412623 RepID=UPI00360542BE
MRNEAHGQVKTPGRAERSEIVPAESDNCRTQTQEHKIAPASRLRSPRSGIPAPGRDSYLICGGMDSDNSKKKFFLLFTVTFTFLFLLTMNIPRTNPSLPPPWRPQPICPSSVSEETITPLVDTKHLLLSAYVDQRVKGFDLRIIGIFKRDSIRPLYCRFCCTTRISSTTPATIIQHSDNFGFPYTTTDVLCQIPDRCRATHVALLTDRRQVFNQTWLPIRNRAEERKLQFNFTVCISTLFGGYNNVLQVAQSLEMYRLLGVGRVVIYNTNCGPDLERLLQGYVQEGFVEMVPWPIDKHLVPSTGWLFSRSGGDVHYFGQQATLNECIYRSMERSRYVLLNDIDEIAMPYKYDNLTTLMENLQKYNPRVGVFLIENHIFPKIHFESSGKFHLPQWEGIPGVNILEHIFKEEPDRSQYHPHKMIVQPRMVEQTSVHEVLKNFGQRYNVPQDVCRLIHVRVPMRGNLKLEELTVDTRLWAFSKKMIPNVDKALKRAGLLSPEGQS